MSTSNPVPKIYRAVIDDVIKNVRESFLNEGVDEQVLQELKQLWESKLLQSRAIEFMPTDVNVRVSLTYPHHLPPPMQVTSEAGPSTTASQQPGAHTAHAAHIIQTQHGAPHQVIQNQASQLVYVAHPTLGNVQMTRSAAGASAQATLALQDPRTGPATLLPQNIAIAQGVTSVPQLATGLGIQQVQQLTGLAQPTQVIQIQGSQPHTAAAAQAALYPTFQPNRGPRVIFTQQPAPGQAKQQVIQVDGANDSSSEDDLDDDDYDNYPMPAAGPSAGDDPEDAGEEEEPLNSEDDVSEEDPTDFFDTDNVVVCQYDKIARTRNRWKFHLKDGIMNLKSKDYVFHKANGDSEW